MPARSVCLETRAPLVPAAALLVTQDTLRTAMVLVLLVGQGTIPLVSAHYHARLVRPELLCLERTQQDAHLASLVPIPLWRAPTRSQLVWLVLQASILPFLLPPFAPHALLVCIPVQQARRSVYLALWASSRVTGAPSVRPARLVPLGQHLRTVLGMRRLVCPALRGPLVLLRVPTHPLCARPAPATQFAPWALSSRCSPLCFRLS
jgi:hypothetical protein